MSKSGTRCALWFVPVTLELSLPTYHACNTLWFRRSSVFPCCIGTILVVGTVRILRFQLRLPREIVEVAIIIVDRVEGHIRRGMERMGKLRRFNDSC